MEKNICKIIDNKKIQKIKSKNNKTFKNNQISLTSKYYKVRQRALCLQLSYKKYTIKELSDVFKVTYLTIHRWLDRWNQLGLPGLYYIKSRGRKPSLNPQQQLQVKNWVKSTPKQIKFVKLKIETK